MSPVKRFGRAGFGAVERSGRGDVSGRFGPSTSCAWSVCLYVVGTYQDVSRQNTAYPTSRFGGTGC
jgi:hypothetical protein